MLKRIFFYPPLSSCLCGDFARLRADLVLFVPDQQQEQQQQPREFPRLQLSPFARATRHSRVCSPEQNVDRVLELEEYSLNWADS